MYYFSKDDLFLSINGANAPAYDLLVTGCTYMGDGIIFGLVLVSLLVMKRWRLFLVGLTVFLLVTLIVQSIKHYVNEPRPLAYFSDPAILHSVEWMKIHSGLSFPSGHTSTAFGMYCFLALIWNNKRMGLVLFLLGLATGHSRIYLSQHFFADVYVGSIIGTVSCLLVYWAFEVKKSQTPGAACPHNTVVSPQPM